MIPIVAPLSSTRRNSPPITTPAFGGGFTTIPLIQREVVERFRWVSTLFPTQAFAQEAEMSFVDYEAFVFEACHVDETVGDPLAYWEGSRKSRHA
jgi:hypothetical protein